MNSKQDKVRQILIDSLTRINIGEKDYENLGERLDSLDRLTVITDCEDSLSLDLTEILIEPTFWFTFLTLVESLERIFYNEVQ